MPSEVWGSEARKIAVSVRSLTHRTCRKVYGHCLAMSNKNFTAEHPCHPVIAAYEGPLKVSFLLVVIEPRSFPEYRLLEK